MKKEIALKMVRQAFDKGVELGRLDEDTANTYYNRLQNFVNNGIPNVIGEDVDEHKLYNPKFWKGSTVDGWFTDLTDRFHEGDVSGSYIINSVHAFSKLQDLVSQDKVWKGIDKVRVGLKGSVEEGRGRLYDLHAEGIGMNADEVTSIKPKGGELEKIIDAVKEVLPEDHKNYETVVNILISQRMTGGRITAECNLKVGDINLDTGTKRYDKDKNDYTRRVPIKNEHSEFFNKLIEGKEAGAPVFAIFDSKGKQMSKRKAGKYVQEVLHKAAEKSGVNTVDEDGKKSRYTSHSSRRGYAQELYNSTRYVKKQNIRKMMADYINKQGSNKEGILERIQAEKERLNYYRIKKGLPMKDFSWEQLRRLYVSLHMGHQRIDHAKRYIDYDEPISKRK